MDLSILRQMAEELIPFNKLLGVRVESMERGAVTLSVPFRDELIGDPLKHALHGGVLSAVADAAGGFAVWSAVEHPEGRVSTVDLRVDYLRPGRPETIIVSASITRVGARLGWADVRIHHPGAERNLVATARGVYAIKVPKHTRAE
jgi:uncharacterized protein (TIGR00369 family)